MKKIIFVFSFLFVSIVFSQTIVENFDPIRPGSAFFQDNGGGTVGISQVADPEVAGTRGNVLRLATTAGEPWQGAGLILQSGSELDLTNDPIDPDEKKVKIWIYIDNGGVPFDFLAKVTTGGVASATDATHSGLAGWEELTFDFDFGKDNTAPANGIYSRITFFPGWRSTNGCVNGCYPDRPVPNITMFIDEIISPVPPPLCTTALSTTSATCDTTGSGATDDTYIATVAFSGANNGNDFVVSTTSGTIGGENPDTVASGTITITGITEGTDITVTVDDTADGGNCSLSTTITSPSCLPPPTCAELVLESFDGTAPTLGQDNGAPVPTIVSDPDPNKVGLGKDKVLQVVTNAGGAPWQQAELTLQNDFLDLTTDKTVSIDWYSENSFDAFIRVDSRLGGGNAATAAVPHSGGGWQTLVFDFNTPAQSGNGFGVPNGVFREIFFFNLFDIIADDFTGGATGSTASNTYVDNIYQGTVVKTTYTYDGTWLLPEGDPTGSSGCFDTIDIVSGDISITSDTEVDNLIVAPGASLTVATGVTLTTESVNLNSTSTEFSSLILDGNITGTINYNRFTTIVGTNDLISPPLSGQTFGDFEMANVNLASQGTLRAFAPYDTTAGEYQNYDTVLDAGTVINPGNGYRMATTDGSPLTFTGIVLDADVLDISISDAVAGNAWNLIGNPYPTYIDFATFFNLNKAEFETGAFQAIYGYNGTGWTVWNDATIADTDVTELITPGQGFFVKSKDSGGLVDFTTVMRTSGTIDDFIPGRSSNTLNLVSSKLILSNADQDAKTRIYFIEGKSRGLDSGFDAGAFRGSAGDFSIFTYLVEDNEGLDMDIQTLGYDDFNNVVIPLGVKALANSTLTIKLDENSNLPSNINVYLEDTLENTLTLLNTSAYSFVPTSDLDGAGRFFLYYSSSTLSLNPNNNLNQFVIYANHRTKDVTIEGILNAKTKAELYDLQGRLVLTYNLNQADSINTIDVSSLTAGVYVIKVSDNMRTKSQKLIIK